MRALISWGDRAPHKTLGQFRTRKVRRQHADERRETSRPTPFDFLGATARPLRKETRGGHYNQSHMKVFYITLVRIESLRAVPSFVSSGRKTAP